MAYMSCDLDNKCINTWHVYCATVLNANLPEVDKSSDPYDPVTCNVLLQREIQICENLFRISHLALQTNESHRVLNFNIVVFSQPVLKNYTSTADCRFFFLLCSMYKNVTSHSTGRGSPN